MKQNPGNQIITANFAGSGLQLPTHESVPFKWVTTTSTILFSKDLGAPLSGDPPSMLVSDSVIDQAAVHGSPLPLNGESVTFNFYDNSNL